MDPQIIKDTWAEVSAYGHDNVALDFYSRLFLEHPDTRQLFGADMADQRRKITAMLTLVVRSVDDLEAVIPTLQRLGRKHVSYRAVEDHYKAVGGALLQTLAHFLDDHWTEEVAATWTEAYTTVAGVMVDAARQTAHGPEPAAWDAPIVHVERRPDRVWLVVDPGPTFPGATRVRASLNAYPGTWVMVDLVPVPTDRWGAAVTLDDSNPVTLALCQAHRGDVLRLGLEPLEEL